MAQLAAAAGTTERTFFRHFADKREALFARELEMHDALVSAVRDAPADASLHAAVAAVGEALQPRPAALRRRDALIGAHPALRERELVKLEATGGRARHGAGGARHAGAARPSRRELAVTVLRVAFARWIARGERRTYAAAIADAPAESRTVFGPA